MNPRHFQVIPFERSVVTHNAALGGRAAHIKGQDLRHFKPLTVPRRHQCARRRSRLQHAHGKTSRHIRRQGAATRAHDQKASFETGRRQTTLKTVNVVVNKRLDVGVQAGGGPALIFASKRENHR